jgi:glycosyltransferase involved in cell wall biosynthesis
MERAAESGPLVSVIIPVYNCEQYLAEAIESALAQTYGPVEIIVVDDGSTDSSSGVARGFEDLGVRYFHQPNSGPGAARNLGVRMAQGSFFAFLDADDIWIPGKLSLQMAAFEDEAELDMVFGRVMEFLCPSSEASLKTEVKTGEGPLAGYYPGTMVVKRESFFRVGPFATNWRVGEFIDWFSKADEEGLKSLIVPEVVTKRRIHDTNVGIRERHSQTDYLRILKQAMDRRREKEPGDTSKQDL